LKGGALVGRPNGKKVVTNILQECHGRYLVVAHLKPYALACKFFEYIFEPAVSDFNSFLYGVDFHRVISNLLFVYFRAQDKSAESLLSDFTQFAHRGDIEALQRIFPSVSSRSHDDDLLSAVGTFALLHQEEIKNEVLSFRQNGVPNWILDLTTTSLFGLLTSWGERARELEVICDHSKPLQGDMMVFDAMVNRTETTYVRFQNKERPFTFNLRSPITMADSKSTPGLQLADVLAATSAFVWKSSYRGQAKDVEQWQELLKENFGDENIWPDLGYADLSTPECFANTIILRELVDRSVKRQDLYEGLPEMFRAAWQIHPLFLEENAMTRRVID
jgi:hypothetical protein